MIDFLFSFDREKESECTKALSIYRDTDKDPLHAYHGDWGVLVTKGHPYPGFECVETSRYLLAPLGGPLPRNHPSRDSGSPENQGSHWILHQWKTGGGVRWDNDLVGSFLILCVDKKEKRVELVTDLNGFISAYHSCSTPVIIGSHADAVARAAGVSHTIDPVSIADFLSYRTVTYPHTMYHGVKHIPPASITTFTPPSQQATIPYWEPRETKHFATFREAVEQTRETVRNNVRLVCSGQRETGVLLSGGEDSRAVLSFIPGTTGVRAFTITDGYNREAGIAEMICRAQGAQWIPIHRSPTHYLDHALQAVRLCESHNFFLNAHLLGFEHHFPAGTRMLGGVAADSLLKGYGIRRRSKFGITLRIDSEDWGEAREHRGKPFRQEVMNRRMLFNERLKELRPDSWAEWHNLFPACMHSDFTFNIVNRRIFPSYEPFADSQIIKLASCIPQKWKIDRRLYHQAMRPAFKDTWRIPHSEGWYPYFGNAPNIPIRIMRKAVKRFRNAGAGHGTASSGPWPNWSDVVTHPKFKALCPSTDEILDCIPCNDNKRLLQTLLTAYNENPCPVLTLRLFQVKLWLHSSFTGMAPHTLESGT